MEQAPAPPPPFWRFLAEWLRTRGESQRDLAKDVGVHETVVSKWLHKDERVRIRPGSSTLPELARALGINMEELIGMITADREALENRRVAARIARRSYAAADDPELTAAKAELDAGWPTWDEGFRRAVRTLIGGGAERLLHSYGYLLASS